MECSFRDSEREEILKTCDNCDLSLLKKLESRHQCHSQHLSIGRETGRAPTGRAPIGRAPSGRAPTQESATIWVPGSTCIKERINFPFPANTPVCTVLVKWSQLGDPGSSGGIRRFIHGSSPSKDCSPTCNKTIESESRLQVHYKKESLSATGSSKTPHNLVKSTSTVKSTQPTIPTRPPYRNILNTV